MVFSREFVDFVIRHNLWPSRHKRSAHRDYNCPRDYFLLWHGRTLHRAQIIIILADGQVLRNGVIVMWESRKSQIPISGLIRTWRRLLAGLVGAEVYSPRQSLKVDGDG